MLLNLLNWSFISLRLLVCACMRCHPGALQILLDFVAVNEPREEVKILRLNERAFYLPPESLK